jgi:UDP-N-acetylmuramoyl-L-alanyl-D-glutamate--2,6-diaminopimelate ligase
MFQKIKNIYHLFQAILANLWYRFPSRQLKVIGVTGTDGKTTTTHLIAHLLKSVGKKTSFISSIYAYIGGEEYDLGFHVTTPSPFAIQKFLRRSADHGDEFFVLETTSHALDQNRVWGVKYEIGVLTNISHEHLDYHVTYEEYANTKIRLLKSARKSVINKDDSSTKYIKSQLKGLKCYYYSARNKPIDQIENITEFNKENYAAAYTVAKLLKISDEKILKSIASFQLPKGRLEIVYDKEFKIIVDFAHTPNAFENLLPEIKQMHLGQKGKLIHVFGSAGLRDSMKRPFMGQSSSRYSDRIILTEEDFRTEKFKDICSQIASGIKKDLPYEIIEDREQAILKAVLTAKKGDIVLLTGKAHEKSLCRGKKEYPWNEYEAVNNAISKLKS